MPTVDPILNLRDLIPPIGVRELSRAGKLQDLGLLYLKAREIVLRTCVELSDEEIEVKCNMIGQLKVDEFCLFYELLGFVDKIDFIRFSVVWAIITRQID
jgi:hypothetical protein